jgi:cold-inducible RNA-binding protein
MTVGQGKARFTRARRKQSVVDEIRVIIDRDTGRSKGFGFLEMPDSTTATTAIAGLQGTELAGRTLTVNEAKPRAPRREPSRSRW